MPCKIDISQPEVCQAAGTFGPHVGRQFSPSSPSQLAQVACVSGWITVQMCMAVGPSLSSVMDYEMTSFRKCTRQSGLDGSVDRLCGATPSNWAANHGNKEAVEVCLVEAVGKPR